MDPLLRSSMQQASFKCETPRLELKSSRSFLSIEHCQRTKSKKVIKQSRSSIYKLAHIICATSGKAVLKRHKFVSKRCIILCLCVFRNAPIQENNYCSCHAGVWYFHCYDSYKEVVFWIFLAHPLLFNSLTPKSIPAGTKNSRSEGFLLVKHKHTNIPTMMEPFLPPAAWFWWTNIPHPQEPLRRGLEEAVVEGF